MRLQFAMDTLSTESALDLAAKAAPYVDILELGTPLIKSEGLAAITAVKAAHPDKTVFADLKTMDAGELEADIAFTAGADLVTVLGVAGDSTIAGAVAAATKHGKGVVVDLIGVSDKAARAREVVALGAVFVEMHAGLDEQAEDGSSTPCSPPARPPEFRSPSPAASARTPSRPSSGREQTWPSRAAPSTAHRTSPARPPPSAPPSGDHRPPHPVARGR